ncbi:MAG: galactose mutarotase [Clostridia bacterium]|nr:galactose mutarotase [Clostridia bacterium]
MNSYLFDKLPDGRDVIAYEIGNDTVRATILNYGGIIQKLLYKGIDIIGGYDKVEGYLVSDGYQGALIGRYANRIRDAKFTLNGVEYQLAANESARNNHLHGGMVGYDKKIWDVAPKTDCDGEHLVLTLVDPDGNENYPGTVNVKVTYSVCGENFSIHYEAVSDKDTPFNMTNHAYLNMNGIAGGTIYDQTLQVNADFMSSVDDKLIPVAKVPVDGTPFDFRTPKLLSEELMHCDDEQMKKGEGLDHNLYITTKEATLWQGKKLAKAAVFAGKLGALTLYTDTPCVQFYAGNFMDGDYPFKGGLNREKNGALCLETQFAPDGPNRGEAILRAGEKYDYTALFRFE